MIVFDPFSIEAYFRSAKAAQFAFCFGYNSGLFEKQIFVTTVDYECLQSVVTVSDR